MSDTLHLVYDNNPDELSNMPSIIKIVDYTVQVIPTLKEIKRMKKIIVNLDEEEDREESHDEEENGNINDQNSDVQKILQHVRDYIITDNLSIRVAFGLPDGFHDYYFEFHEFKALLKQI